MAASHLTVARPGNSAANPPRDVPITWDCSGRGQRSLNSYQLFVIRPIFRSLPTRCVFVQSFPLRLEKYYPRHNVSRLQWPLVRSLVDKLLSPSPFSCSPSAIILSSTSRSLPLFLPVFLDIPCRNRYTITGGFQPRNAVGRSCVLSGMTAVTRGRPRLIGPWEGSRCRIGVSVGDEKPRMNARAANVRAGGGVGRAGKNIARDGCSPSRVI